MVGSSEEPGTRAQPAAGAAGLRLARTIASALPLGVIAFWGIAWFVSDGGSAGRAEGAVPGGFAFQLWLVVALGGMAGALYFRGRAIAVAEATRRAGMAGSRAGEVQTFLLIAWALLEAQALLAGVLLLVLGLERVVAYAAAVYLIGLGLTWPRAEWWGVDERDAWR